MSMDHYNLEAKLKKQTKILFTISISIFNPKLFLTYAFLKNMGLFKRESGQKEPKHQHNIYVYED